jgi:hypothetical protein
VRALVAIANRRWKRVALMFLAFGIERMGAASI